MPYQESGAIPIYADGMKELRITFSEEEYAKLDDMRGDGQSVEDFVRECLQTALPWIEWPVEGGYWPEWLRQDYTNHV